MVHDEGLAQRRAVFVEDIAGAEEVEGAFAVEAGGMEHLLLQQGAAAALAFGGGGHDVRGHEQDDLLAHAVGLGAAKGNADDGDAAEDGDLSPPVEGLFADEAADGDGLSVLGNEGTAGGL